MRGHLYLVVAASGLLWACGGSPTMGGTTDAGGGVEDASMEVDAGVDAAVGMDAGADAAVDMDAGADAAVDMDAGADAAVDMDAGADAAVDMDAGADAAVDMDAGFDGGADAGTDAGFDGGADAGTDAGPADGPGAFESDYATSSAFFTRMSHPADSGSIHGTVRIWYSTNIMSFSTSGPFAAPVGTVAIKEEYDSTGMTLTGKTVMIKQAPGYDTANHDWYYEVRNPDDTLSSSFSPGMIGACSDCHQGAPTTDYLQGFGISN